MDRIIRLYNPYVPLRPIAHLKGHTTPIFFIHLSGDDERIFTMSTDKCLNVTKKFTLILQNKNNQPSSIFICLKKRFGI